MILPYGCCRITSLVGVIVSPNLTFKSLMIGRKKFKTHHSRVILSVPICILTESQLLKLWFSALPIYKQSHTCIYRGNSVRELSISRQTRYMDIQKLGYRSSPDIEIPDIECPDIECTDIEIPDIECTDIESLHYSVRLVIYNLKAL